MLIRKVLLALVLVVGLAAAGLAEVQHLQNITVKLPGGTGVYINNNKILTVAHGIKTWMENAVWVINGEYKTVARVIKIDRELDLALLEIIDEAEYPEVLFKLETEVDEKVVSMVNFGELEDIFLRGRIAGYGNHEGKEYIIIDMKIIPGMSGSGVFSEGKLIGIIQLLYGNLKMGDFVALIIPAKRIVKFLED